MRYGLLIAGLLACGSARAEQTVYMAVDGHCPPGMATVGPGEMGVVLGTGCVSIGPDAGCTPCLVTNWQAALARTDPPRYSIAEIDEMRDLVRKNLTKGLMWWSKGTWETPPQGPGVYYPNVIFTDATLAARVEDQVRTYMTAGVRPSDLKAIITIEGK